MVRLALPLWVASGLWPWLKKYGPWILVLLLAGAMYLLGRSHREVVVVDSGQQLQEAGEYESQVVLELRERVAELEAQRDELIADVLEEHEETVEELTDEQEDRVDELLEDPGALNDYLLDVGRRAGSSND